MGIARIAILVVAALAAGVAALLVRNLVSDDSSAVANAPAQIVQMPTTEVLVAAQSLERGQRISASSLHWQSWPDEALSPNYVLKSANPTALEEAMGSIVRVPMSMGEPLAIGKIVSAADTGFMAAVLAPGMRAISTRISPETSAGGFILPNDHVDVIVTERQKNAYGTDITTSITILKNIRVLAVDQTFREIDTESEQVVIGKTVTLELTPRQAEVLARSNSVGELSLSLRSLADSGPNAVVAQVDDEQGSYGTIRIFRYGSEASVSVGSAR